MFAGITGVGTIKKYVYSSIKLKFQSKLKCWLGVSKKIRKSIKSKKSEKNNKKN